MTPTFWAIAAFVAAAGSWAWWEVAHAPLIEDASDDYADWLADEFSPTIIDRQSDPGA